MYYNKKEDDAKYRNTILQNIAACSTARNSARDVSRQVITTVSNCFLELFPNFPANNTITSVLDTAAAPNLMTTSITPLPPRQRNRGPVSSLNTSPSLPSRMIQHQHKVPYIMPKRQIPWLST
jgi:hypothetical protein